MSRDVAIVIGTVVGGYFGEPGLGYAIGSMVGNAYDPVKIGQQGPRLNDLKVQTSDYGKMIPVMYGASRFAGNVIWSTDVVETSHTQDSGGKGGGPVTTTTTYTYSQSFAIALCEGEIAGIRKIWANGKLIYNVGADSDIETIIASHSKSASFRVYTGTETQIADSLIQSYIGAANTPAYRGTAYIVFENFQLADFGNRLPNFEFEVIEAGTSALPYWVFTDNVTGGARYGRVVETLTGYWWTTDGYDNVQTNGIGFTSYDFIRQVKTITPWGARLPFVFTESGSAKVYFTWTDGISPVMKSITDANTSPVTVAGVTVDFTYTHFIVDEDGVFAIDSYGWTGQAGLITSNGEIWLFSASAGSIGRVNVYRQFDRTFLQTVGGFYCLNLYEEGLAFEFNNHVYYVNPKTGSLPTYKINMATRVATSLGLPAGDAFWGSVTYYSGKLYFAYSGTLRVYDLLTESLESNITLPFSATLNTLLIDSRGVLVGRSGSNFYVSTIFIPVLTSSAPALSSIVSDICTRAGLTAAQIDVTQLTDTIDGYVTQRSTARVRIEQLMQAFYFDAVESDGKVKFVKRGGAAALTISEDDLAAHTYGGSIPDNLLTERKQEMELPVEVNVQYMDTTAAYQVNSQRSQRLITDSSNKMTLNFAISMDASKAKQISDVLMFDAWTARTSFGLMNGWKYSYLEPTDVIGVTKGAYTYNVRIVEDDASGGVYNRSAVMDDASVYTQTANAAAPISPSTTVSSAPLLNLVLMDIPLLRDQDDGVGFYAAACAYSGTWSGEQTFKSNDGGATWSQSGRAILNEATVGTASTELGNFSSGNFFDELNSVTVVMLHGTLSSDTELNVLNGSNVALLGSEVIQFKSAELTAANTYKLTGLLRGRRGTEWAMSTHVVGDRFVMLSTTTTYIFDSSSSEYNLARKYRGVAIGGFLDDALDIDFTNTAVAQECYAPVQLGGGRNASNDIIINWVRRTRIGGAWNNYADVPLGETTEAYVVEIYSSGTYATLLRTISGLTSTTTTYTAAQQTADGLTPGNTVYFIVYQVSATVGNGYGARGAV